MGHVWPVFFRFRGGRGVSTAAGILFALHQALGAASAATWCIIAFFFRFSSLAALVTAVFATLYHMLIFGPKIFSASLIIIGCILVFRQRSNIHHLYCGSQSRNRQK